jgi:hypothetical protein
VTKKVVGVFIALRFSCTAPNGLVSANAASFLPTILRDGAVSIACLGGGRQVR